MALTDKLTAIADAIRGKTGTTEEMTLDRMATEIAGIETGGGDTSTIKELLDGTLTHFSDSTITKLRAEAFYNHTSLQEVNMPELTEIGSRSFSYTGLKSAYFPKVTTIQYYSSNGGAFDACKSLESIDFPAVVSIRGACNFRNCTKLTSVKLPNLESFGYGERTFYGCTALERIKFPKLQRVPAEFFTNATLLSVVVLGSSEVATLSNVNAFNGTPFASGKSGGTIYVPQALIESYKTATNWSTLYAAGTCNFVAIEGSEYE